MALALWLLPPGSERLRDGARRCTRSTPTASRRPTTGRPADRTPLLQDFFNLTMFNIGFHIEHHAHPECRLERAAKLHDRLKVRLVAGGAHVVPFGYYRAGRLLCRRAYRESAGAEWAAQHAGDAFLAHRLLGRSARQISA